MNLNDLCQAWRTRWPEALGAWSKFTRLREPRWCLTHDAAAGEGLTGSFAMIRLSDQAVVIDLAQVSESHVEAFPLEILAHEIGHHVYAPANLNENARMIARMPWNYLDATNLNPKERRHWIQMAREFGYEVHAVFFDVPLEVCLDRNRRRQRVVPEDVMQRLASKLRPPKFDEGFSKITVVRVKPGTEPHV